MSTALALATCVACRAAFAPRDRHQVTCGATRCRERRRYELQMAKPAYVEGVRTRCARWYAAQHPARRPTPWLRGAPAYAAHLPGGACELRLTPAAGIPLAKAHYLHGMLSAIDGRPHDRLRPAWSLLPWQAGWAVVWHDGRGAPRAGTTHLVTLYGRPASLALGPLVRLRTPVVARRGRHRLRLEAVTPVSIRTTPGHKTTLTRLVPTASSLLSTLALTLGPRLGVTLGTDDLRLEVLGHRTETVTLDGGKFGRSWGRATGEDCGVRGWVGTVLLECNAPARWLLECAARGWGLGGRCSIGCGRVRLTEVDDERE